MMLRPMRPNPLIPTLIAIRLSSHPPLERPRNRHILHAAPCRLVKSAVYTSDRCKSLHVLRLQRSGPRLFCRVSPWFLYQAIRYKSTSPASVNGWATCPFRSIWTPSLRSGSTPSPSGKSSPRGRCPRSEGALSAAARVPLDDHIRGAAAGAAQPAGRRCGVLFSVRSQHLRAPNAEPRAPAPLRHDGDRDLAQPAARMPAARDQDRDCERPSVAAFVSTLSDGAGLHEGRARRYRSLLRAERRVGAAVHRARSEPRRVSASPAV